MFIIDGIVNFVSVAPDSFAPLKHISAINLIFWIAMGLFLFENALHSLGQSFAGSIPSLGPFVNPQSVLGGLSAIINQSCIIFGFPIKFIELIYPFSPFIYSIVKGIYLIYGIIVGILNGLLGCFTEKQLDLVL